MERCCSAAVSKWGRAQKLIGLRAAYRFAVAATSNLCGNVVCSCLIRILWGSRPHWCHSFSDTLFCMYGIVSSYVFSQDFLTGVDILLMRGMSKRCFFINRHCPALSFVTSGPVSSFTASREDPTALIFIRFLEI